MPILLVAILIVATDASTSRSAPRNSGQDAVSEDGTVVWLVGIGDEDNRWWRPDGTPMDPPGVTADPPPGAEGAIEPRAVGGIVWLGGGPPPRPKPPAHLRKLLFASSPNTDYRLQLDIGPLFRHGIRGGDSGSLAVFQPDGTKLPNGSIATIKFDERPDIKTADLRITVGQIFFDAIADVAVGEERTFVVPDGPADVTIHAKAAAEATGERTLRLSIAREDGTPIRDSISVEGRTSDDRYVSTESETQRAAGRHTIKVKFADDAPPDATFRVLQERLDPILFKNVRLFSPVPTAE